MKFTDKDENVLRNIMKIYRCSRQAAIDIMKNSELDDLEEAELHVAASQPSHRRKRESND